MDSISFLDLFQGIATLVASEPKIMIGRIVLMLLGFLLHFTPDSWENAACRGVIRLPFLGKALLMVALIYLVIQVKSSDIQPFIYFQF